MLKTTLLLCIALLLAVPSAFGAIVNFDDLGSGFNFVPTNYAGLTWDSGWFSWDGSGYQSAPNAAYFITNPLGFSFPTAVQFAGAYFLGSNSSLRFEMYYNSSLVATTSFMSVSGTPQFLYSNYSGPVDHVDVRRFGGDWVMDDVYYNQAPPAPPVPEPATSGGVAVSIAAGIAALLRKESATLPLDPGRRMTFAKAISARPSISSATRR